MIPAGPGSGTDTDTASQLAEEQRRAVRLLLAHPFISDAMPDPEPFALARRHARELQRWLSRASGSCAMNEKFLILERSVHAVRLEMRIHKEILRMRDKAQ